MDYRRSRVYTASVPKMPPGLVEIMEGLSKDVLRNNPTNIYEFCADHIDKLLQIRNTSHRKKSINLKQKISIAQEIIRDRARQRREKYNRNNKFEELILNKENYAMEVRPDGGSFSDQSVTKKDNTSGSHAPETAFLSEIAVNETILSDITMRSIDYKEANPLQDNIDCEDRAIVDKNDFSKNVSTKININEGQDEIATKIVCTDQSFDISNKTSNSESNTVMTRHFLNNDRTVFQSDENNTSSVTDNSIIDLESVDIQKKLEETTLTSAIKLNNMSEISERSVQGKIYDEKENVSNVEVIQHKMDLETAAITIQKVFRNFLFKSKTTSLDDATNVDINLFIGENNLKDNMDNCNVNKERRGISRMDTVLQTVNEEKSLSLSTDDSSTVSSAATIIQAHIRGFLVRNKFNVKKMPSTASQDAPENQSTDSDGFPCGSFDIGNDQQKTKTILNIHIVPERERFANKDESLLTSNDLSVDDSPLTMSLHPHFYGASERRKQLKREDAVQSTTPPSNNSTSKLSEDLDSVKEMINSEYANKEIFKNCSDNTIRNSIDDSISKSQEIQTAVEEETTSPRESFETAILENQKDEDALLNEEDRFTETLTHSGEFHEVVVPTKVSRNDISIVREFDNALAYILLWDYR